ncbi:MAG TPA: hypothetical protein DCP08_07325, partial [Chloroflexi bacterium]|nr:hypothetical protein [Chloroflexota bacterium]
DQEADIRRLGEVHHLLTRHRGSDRFTLYLPREEGVVQLDFPNASTGYSPELERALIAILGGGSLRVETTNSKSPGTSGGSWQGS